MKKALFKNSFITGTLFLTIAGVLTRIIGFFYRIFLSRMIGAEGLGIYQLIAPITALGFAITAAGIQTSISKFVSMEIGKNNLRRKAISCHRTCSFFVLISAHKRLIMGKCGLDCPSLDGRRPLYSVT